MTDAAHMALCILYIIVYTAFVSLLCYNLRLWDRITNCLDPRRGLLSPLYM
jgi:hypothetical protein